MYYKWLFAYFNYFLFLTIYRVFSPNIDKIKLICSKFNVYASFVSSKNLKSVFSSKFTFFSATNLVLCSNALFSIGLLNEITTVFSGFLISNFLFNRSFLNFYFFTIQDFLNILNVKQLNISLVFDVFMFIFSNFFILLSHFSFKTNSIDDELTLFKKLLSTYN